MSSSRQTRRRLGWLLLPGAAAALLVGALFATPAQRSHGATSGVPLTWGNNEKGQLGDGTLTSRPDPENVMGLSGIVQVAGGGRHSLALRSDGAVFAWGSNDRGQLGDGTTIDEKQPVQVRNLSNVVAIAAGGEFSMALTADGSVWTWGDDSYGQLGDGLLPAGQPAGMSGDCAGIMLGGSCVTNVHVRGDGDSMAVLPEQAPGLSRITQIAAGQNFALALTADGTVLGWGEDDHGELASYGDAFTLGAVPMPVPVLAAAGGLLGSVTSIAAGAHHGLTRMSDGTVEAWGLDDAGQLGNAAGVDGNCQCRDYALPVLDAAGNPLTGLRAVSGGGQHSLAIRDADGAVYAWGDNSAGQLGDGTLTSRETPKEVQGLLGIIQIAAGGQHSLALGGLQLTVNGQHELLTIVYGWGLNSSGQAGTHRFDDAACQCRKLAATVTGGNFTSDVLRNVTDIAAGDIHSLAIASAAAGRFDQQLTTLQFVPDGGGSTVCQPGACPPPPCTANCPPTSTASPSPTPCFNPAGAPCGSTSTTPAPTPTCVPGAVIPGCAPLTNIPNTQPNNPPPANNPPPKPPCIGATRC